MNHILQKVLENIAITDDQKIKMIDWDDDFMNPHEQDEPNYCSFCGGASSGTFCSESCARADMD